MGRGGARGVMPVRAGLWMMMRYGNYDVMMVI
jgi:hypothetical protein